MTLKKHLPRLIALCLLPPLCASAGEVLRVAGCDEWMPGADNERVLLADTAVEAAFPGLAVVHQTATTEELDAFSARAMPENIDIFMTRSADWPGSESNFLDVTPLYAESGFKPFGTLTGTADKAYGVPLKIYAAMAEIKNPEALAAIGLSIPFTWEELFAAAPAFVNWRFKEGSPLKLVRDNPFAPIFLWQAGHDAKSDPKADENLRPLAVGWKDLYDRGLIATGNEPALIEITFCSASSVKDTFYPLPAVTPGGVTSVLSAQTCVGNAGSARLEAVNLWLKTLLSADAGDSGLPGSQFVSDRARGDWQAALDAGCARTPIPAFLRTWKNIMTGMLPPEILGGK